MTLHTMERLVFWHRWLLPSDLDDRQLQQSSTWVGTVCERVSASGGSVVARVGGSVVATFGITELSEAVDLALEMLAAQEQGLDLAIALSVGEIAETRAGGPLFGEAFERAQALANSVPGGNLVLDVGAQQLVAGEYLFSHAVTSPDGVSGELLDRAHPRRRDCRAALTQLRPITPVPAAAAQFSALRQLAGGEGRHRVALVGPQGVGAAQWLRSLAERQRPPLWLNVIPVAGSMAPLGAMGYALRRVQRGEQPVDHWLDPNDERDGACSKALAAMREGRAMSRRAATGALRHLLYRVHQKTGERAWLSLNPVSQLDPASLRVSAEATREGAPASLTVLRLLPGQKAPASFASGTALTEIRIPALTHREAHAVAMSLLGEHAEPDIARKAALTGGPTVLGVVEAVRTMVSSGEVVHEGGAFHWRRGPGGRGGVVPVESLVEQRLEQLEAAPRRLLEGLVTVPDAAEGQVVEEVARRDGLGQSARAFALELLLDEGFVSASPGGFDVSLSVRGVVHLAMPSARRAELCRFVGQVLEDEGSAEAEFGRATLGYYYAHGGRPAEAVRLFMETAQLAGKLGWVRTAVRLAAAAVQTDPSTRTREAAARLTHSLSQNAHGKDARKAREGTERSSFGPVGPPSRPDLPSLTGSAENMGETAIQRAIAALMARDTEEVERSLELATASGHGSAAVERLRAMSLLSRGDHHGALRVLKKAAQAGLDGGDREQARAALAEALVWLEADHVPVALRSALRALAAARAHTDAHGVRASLRTLATCYRRLGREQDARVIETSV